MMAPMQIIYGKAEAIRRFETRSFEVELDTSRRIVEDTLAEVRTRGDAALREITLRFDGVELDTFEVPQDAFDHAERSVKSPLKEAIMVAVDRIRGFYQHQSKEGFLYQADGSLLGVLVRPLDRIGCYVPGGTAPLFSSLLMTAVPAQVAGVRDIVVATPPRRDGSVAPEILFAAKVLGLETVYRVGGAQAVAALAYGTPSIPRVDKIVGPGNRFVVLAKQALFGTVGIESLPGPTETLVLADATAQVDHVVADLLAQAEHSGAQPVLVTTSLELIEKVSVALEPALNSLPTEATARASVEQRGLSILVETISEALEVSNAYAPEHLCLLVRDPWSAVSKVQNAGGIFIGEQSMEALGDYLAGPSHVMPTGGTARFSSFVNLRDFQKVIPLLHVSKELSEHIGPLAVTMARAEGLEAHARAIEARLKSV
ncbi:MAG: histidinol dehydrogenase [Trueperaceae bacterium]|nr:MAG: histidinol dehydrogenase [Trueperaceae bacterium]